MVATGPTTHPHPRALSVRVHLDGLPHTCATIDECLAVANRVCGGVQAAERSAQERRLAAGRVLADMKRQLEEQVGYGFWEKFLRRIDMNPRTVRDMMKHAESFTDAAGNIDPQREAEAKRIAAARFGVSPEEVERLRAAEVPEQGERLRAAEAQDPGDDEEDDGLPRRMVNGRRVFDLAALLAKPVAQMSRREVDVLHRASKDDGRGPLPPSVCPVPSVVAPGKGARGEQMTVEDALVAMGEAARAELAELAERLGAACREHDRRRAAELGGQIKDVGARVQRLEPWT